jgi:glucose uptake protein GlcU
MFLSWFIALGPFLLLAARKLSSHRSLITFAACQCLAHASVMAVQTVEAWKHGVHRQFGDVVLFGVIGGILLALLHQDESRPQSFRSKCRKIASLTMSALSSTIRAHYCMHSWKSAISLSLKALLFLPDRFRSRYDTCVSQIHTAFLD